MVQHVKQRWCLQTQLLNLDKAIHDKNGKLCNDHKKNTHIGIGIMVEINKHCINYKPLHCFVTIFFQAIHQKVPYYVHESTLKMVYQLNFT